MSRLAAWARQGFIGIVALLLTISTLWLLGVLNTRPPHSPLRRDSLRTVLIRGPNDPGPTPRQQRHETDIQPTTPELMEVNLDVPAVELAPLEPLNLNMPLPLPNIDSIPLSVAPPDRTSQGSATTAAKAASRSNSSPTVHQANSVDQPPRESAQNPAPAYPARLLEQGIEGKVKVRLLIDESGRVKDVTVLDGDEEFQKAVMAVIWKWRFTPAREEGQAVRVWGIKEIHFRIR